MWLKKIKVDLNEAMLDQRINIVSHERLAELAISINPDLFIVHNYFEHFLYQNNKTLQYLYRIGSKKIFKKLFCNSKKTLFLSKREYDLAKRNYSNEFIWEPPGIRHTVLNNLNFSYGYYKRSGTSSWLPKKLSLLSPKQLIKLFKNDYLEDADTLNDIRCISLIEDEFLSGFKLKFLEMLFNGDLIISRADLMQELKALNLNALGYCYTKDVSKLSIKKLLMNKDLILSEIQLKRRQEHLLNNYSWNKITKRVMDSINI